jgi:hypothetical protein
MTGKTAVERIGSGVVATYVQIESKEPRGVPKGKLTPEMIPDLAKFPGKAEGSVSGSRVSFLPWISAVNARLKIFWGVDDGNVTGSRRFVAQVGVVLAVHAAFATLLASAPRREGTLGPVSLRGYPAILNRRKLLPDEESRSTHPRRSMPRCERPTPPT